MASSSAAMSVKIEHSPSLDRVSSRTSQGSLTSPASSEGYQTFPMMSFPHPRQLFISESPSSLNRAQSIAGYGLRALEDFAPLLFLSVAAPTQGLTEIGGGIGGVTLKDWAGVAVEDVTTEPLKTIGARFKEAGRGSMGRGIGLRTLKHGLPVVIAFGVGCAAHSKMASISAWPHSLGLAVASAGIGLTIKATFVLSWNKWMGSKADKNVPIANDPRLSVWQNALGYCFRIINGITLTESLVFIPLTLHGIPISIGYTAAYLGIDQSINACRFLIKTPQPLAKLAEQDEYQNLAMETSQKITAVGKAVVKSSALMTVTYLTHLAIYAALKEDLDDNVWSRSTEGMMLLLTFFSYEKLWQYRKPMWGACRNFFSGFFKSEETSGSRMNLLSRNLVAINATHNGTDNVFSSDDLETPPSKNNELR